MPKPVVAVSGMDMPNAFATGRDPDHAVVCVTTGLLRRLEPAELEGVLAHELSHVAHKDVAVITVASFLGVVAGLVVRFAFYSQLFGGGRRDQNTAVVLATVIGVSAAVYAISFLLIRALSRYRELAADRAAALLTGRPSALAAAPHQGLRGHRPDPDQGPAHGPGVQRVLLHPGDRQGARRRAVLLHPPEPGAAAGAAGPDLGGAGRGRRAGDRWRGTGGAGKAG